ncbi:MAG: Mut7-C RNAse domain-containing protein [Nitrososphaerales archaeon]
MLGSPRFVVDAMLGSLARKLRIFGFDTLYFRDGPDRELERVSREEARVMVTSDRALAEHAGRHGLVALLVQGRTDRARLVSLLAQARSGGVEVSRGDPRCAVCNSALERVGPERAARSLPRSIAARHRLYFLCAGCGRLYWRGGHWSRLGRLSPLFGGRRRRQQPI